MIVGILGENQTSKSLATLIAQAGHIPRIGKDPTSKYQLRGFQGTPQWAHLSQEADLMILCSNVENLHSFIEKAALRPRNHVLVMPGVESQSGLWSTDFVLNNSDAMRVGVLGGSIVHDEIENNKPSALVVASHFQSFCTLVQNILHSDVCRVYDSSDPLGIHLATIFGNVIQLAMGIADGSRQGACTRGAIASRGLIEGARLATRLGADEHSFLGLAGIGQTVAQLNNHSYYKMGLNIRRKPLESRVIKTLQHIIDLNTDTDISLPLTKAMLAIGLGQIDPELVVDQLMRRRATKE